MGGSVSDSWDTGSSSEPTPVADEAAAAVEESKPDTPAVEDEGVQSDGLTYTVNEDGTRNYGSTTGDISDTL